MFKAWKHFKELIKKCPHHGIEEQMQLTTFYNSLLPDAKVILDASTGGSFMMKTVKEARKLLDNMAANHDKWQVESRTQNRKAGIYEVDRSTFMQDQIAILSKQIADLKAQKSETCTICSGNHNSANCNATVESVQYIKGQGAYGNGNNNIQNHWRSQASNSWNQQPINTYQRPLQPPPGFQQPHYLPQQNYQDPI